MEQGQDLRVPALLAATHVREIKFAFSCRAICIFYCVADIRMSYPKIRLDLAAILHRTGTERRPWIQRGSPNLVSLLRFIPTCF